MMGGQVTEKLLFVLLLCIASAAGQNSNCAQVSGHIFVPHEYNCQYYYECYFGEAILRECPAGRYFDPYLQSCDETPSSGCTISGTPTYCHGTAHDFFPDPNDCGRYIECYNGNQYYLQCPGGLKFNPITKVCQDPAIVTCSEIPSAPPVQSVCYGVSFGHIVVKPVNEYCSYYYICHGADYTLAQCPSGQYFDAARELCDFPTYVSCPLNRPGAPPDPGQTPGPIPTQPIVPTTDPRCSAYSYILLSHPATCSQYILCSSGSAYLVDCPTGLYFVEVQQQCLDPRQSTCTGVTSAPPVTPPPNGVINADCSYPYGDGRLLPFPGNCNKYFECAEGIKVEMDCPAGLWWHQVLGVCDYPYLTPCIT